MCYLFQVTSEKPVREWDVGKKPEVLRYRDQERNERDRDGRSRENNAERDRERDRNDRRRRSAERHRESRSASPNRKLGKKENDPPLRLLDDLFRKTKTTPCIYWLPLTPEQVITHRKSIRRSVFLTNVLLVDCNKGARAIETNGRA